MHPRQKITLMAMGLLLLTLAVWYWPASRKPVPSPSTQERSRTVNRAARTSPPPGSRPARDFSAFVKLSTKGEFPKLTREEIDRYLEARPRTAAALLTAFRLSQDEALLREAMEKFPHDTQVQLASLRLFADPAKRLEILESLKRSDPENGMVDCLSARALFDLGRSDEALATLEQSVGKPLSDYTVLSCQNDEEAYLAAGLPPLEAKMTALFQSTKPLVLQIRNLADGMRNQRESDHAAGDDAAVQSSRDLQLQLASQLPQGGFLVDSLIGMVIEKGVLKEMDTPEARARLEEIESQRKSMIETSGQITALMETAAVPDSDWLLYFDRAKLFGEKSANDWLLEKHPQP